MPPSAEAPTAPVSKEAANKAQEAPASAKKAASETELDLSFQQLGTVPAVSGPSSPLTLPGQPPPPLLLAPCVPDRLLGIRRG